MKYKGKNYKFKDGKPYHRGKEADLPELLEYYDNCDPFRLSFKEYDNYLETRTSSQKEVLFHTYMTNYLEVGEWIRHGKITSKELERGINLLKRYELLIGKILES